MATEKKTIHEAMAAVFAEMPAIEPDASNTHFRSRYTTLGHIIAKVRPVLTKHGLYFVQDVKAGENGRTEVYTVFYTTGGERLDFGPCVVPTSKQDAHGTGSAITYARRYALAAALGVTDQDDDDGNGAARPDANSNGQTRREVPKSPNEAKAFFLNELVRVSKIGDPADAKSLAVAVLDKLKIDKDAATVEQWAEATETVRGFERTGGSIEKWVSA